MIADLKMQMLTSFAPWLNPIGLVIDICAVLALVRETFLELKVSRAADRIAGIELIMRHAQERIDMRAHLDVHGAPKVAIASIEASLEMVERVEKAVLEHVRKLLPNGVTPLVNDALWNSSALNYGISITMGSEISNWREERLAAGSDEVASDASDDLETDDFRVTRAQLKLTQIGYQIFEYKRTITARVVEIRRRILVRALPALALGFLLQFLGQLFS